MAATILTILKGLTLSDVARGTGISLSHVSRILNGSRTPGLSNANKIAAYLGLSLEELNDFLQHVGRKAA